VFIPEEVVYLDLYKGLQICPISNTFIIIILLLIIIYKYIYVLYVGHKYNPL